MECPLSKFQLSLYRSGRCLCLQNILHVAIFYYYWWGGTESLGILFKSLGIY
jgi:hypothetical protein